MKGHTLCMDVLQGSRRCPHLHPHPSPLELIKRQYALQRTGDYV